MTHIDVNFDDVPDKVEPINAGIYTAEIKEAALKPTKDGRSQKVEVKMTIADEQSPFFGRQISDHIGLGGDKPIRLKQIMKSAGLQPGPGGLHVEDLIGKIVRINLKPNSWRDEKTGEMRENVQIGEYLWEVPV